MEWEIERRDGKITATTVKVGQFKLSVHHYIGCGDIWFMSCYGLFDKAELGVMPLNNAQAMAMTKLQIVLEEAMKIITG